MSEQREAEKAAEEHKAKIIAEDDIEARRLGCSTSRYFPADMLRTSFLAGAAWAAPKWVHVNDKWPEPEKMVLVYIPDAAEWQRIRTTIRVKPEGKHNGLVAQWAGAAIGVTHWCELPAAPEVDK